nr:Chain P, PROTEIN (CYCLIC PEPTIDE (GP120)) [synthetic construct]
SIGPGRAFGGG